jgi:hypothetical protein
MTPFDLYQSFTLTTALYKGSGQGSSEAVVYVAFGLGGEGGELAEKIALVAPSTLHQHDDILGELGDVFYYFARTCAEVGLVFSEILGNFDDTAEEKPETGDTRPYTLKVYLFTLYYMGKMGRILERIKKKLRERGGFVGLDELKTSEVFKLDLVSAAVELRRLTHLLGFRIIDVLAANEKKLQSRKDRGKLHGEGDRR